MAGAMCYDVKITILRKIKVEDIYQEYAKTNLSVICPKGQEGQEFISCNVQKPENFCPGAWEGLASKVARLAAGENSPYVRQEGTAIHCCNDGLHPVIYKLERVEG